MLNWTDEELLAANLDPDKVRSIARRFRALSREMGKMGLHVYGASGSGNLIHTSRPTHRDDDAQSADTGSSIADLGMGFDGGDW